MAPIGSMLWRGLRVYHIYGANTDVGKTVLFVGCRSPDEDYLYADSDMRDWTEKDVLDIRAAFSRKSEVTEGCKYVQE